MRLGWCEAVWVFEGIFSVDGIGGGEGERMVREVVATKWVGLAAAIWVQASAGNAYMFAFYSPSLKSVLHYNQLQLNNLGVAKDIGENVGLLAGLAQAGLALADGRVVDDGLWEISGVA